MKCPHCGKPVIPKQTMWDSEARLLADALKEKYKSHTFKGRDAEELAKEIGVAKDNYQACRIWNRLRQLTDIIEGINGGMHYHYWRVK